MNEPIATDNRRQAFVSLLVQAHPQLFGYVLSLLGDRHDAEDVLQRASMIMWKKFDSFDLNTDFIAWACSVAYYEVRNFLRVSGRDRLRFSEALLAKLAEERAEDIHHTSERVDALQQCLKQLGEKSLRLVREAYTGDATIKSLSEEFGRAPQTLYNQLASIRRTLVECVERRVAEEGAL